MSNYPPGVTGMEYQIAGPSSELDETREVEACSKFDTYNVIGTPRHRKGRPPVRRVRARLCTFEGGSVAGILEDHVWFDWECPVCGHENSMEVEAPEPPEYEREDWDY